MIVLKCKDCRNVVDTDSPRTSTKEKVNWTLCERCKAVRNGMTGARTPRELGIW